MAVQGSVKLMKKSYRISLMSQSRRALPDIKSWSSIEDEFSYGREEKVKKIRQGSNPGIMMET